ncbi:MAG: TraR/DksA C4-type zinc finger protein [Anaerolineae bacterium]|nr:TraR/DksA C4-type zinc finger protein [Anaerolineae bacterium]
MPMTYDELQKLLQEQEANLTSQLSTIGSEVREDGVGYSNHMADAGSEVFEQARDVGLRQQLRRTLEDVQRALRKFDDGTYGICESCGGIIDVPRLEALPSARYCVRCQTRLEIKR